MHSHHACALNEAISANDVPGSYPCLPETAESYQGTTAQPYFFYNANSSVVSFSIFVFLDRNNLLSAQFIASVSIDIASQHFSVSSSEFHIIARIVIRASDSKGYVS